MTWVRSLFFHFNGRLRFWLFQAKELVVMTLVAGVELRSLRPRGAQSQQSLLLRLLFLWFFQGQSKVLVFLEHWGGWGPSSWDLEEFWLEIFCLVHFSTLREDQWPQKQQASISRTQNGRLRAALASAVIAFLMDCS